MGGHLEEGTRVLTFCMVALADTPAANLSDWDRFQARSVLATPSTPSGA